MNLSRRLAFGSALTLAVTAGGYGLLWRNTPAIQEIVGQRGPARELAASEVVGVIDATRLGQGPIVALADDGSNVFVLQNHNWLRVNSSGVHGPYGTAVRGAEGSIVSGADIAIRDSLVYVLDRTARAVSIFGIDGSARARVRLGSPEDIMAFMPERIATNSRGDVVVVGFRRGAGTRSTRVLLQLGRNQRFDSLFAHPAELYEAMVPLGAADHWTIIDASYRFTELTPLGLVLRSFQRADPARVPTPDSVRRSLSRYAAYLPGDLRGRLAVPDYLPAVVGAALTERGSFIVAVVAAVDSAWIEEVDSSGKPLAMWTRTPLPLPLGVSAHGVVSIREDVNTTVVERRRFHR